MAFSDEKESEIKKVQEDIQMDERDIRRIEEITEEARIRNKIIRAEIMDAGRLQVSDSAEESGEIRHGGDGDDDDGSGGKKIELTLGKKDVEGGSLTTFGEIFGPGAEISFRPSGDVTVRMDSGRLDSALGNVMHQESAFLGKTGSRSTPRTRVPVVSGLRELLTRRSMDRLRLINSRRPLNSEEVNQFRWLMEGQDHSHVRRWFAPGLDSFNAVRMGEELRQLNKRSLHENLEQDDEEKRAWLKQQIGWRLSDDERKELGWTGPRYGEEAGVLGYVKPYLFITNYDMLTWRRRNAYWWWRDNLFLRTQHNLVRRWLPKKSKLWWATKYKRKAIESMFDDMDEEIYNEKWYKEQGKVHKELEDYEEEIRGFDAFTVQEEKEIEKLYAKWLDEQKKWETLQEAY
ncbi:MAG: hypothetical protein ABIH11_02690 [Candidatus Altiarchaeota archaeon]